MSCTKDPDTSYYTFGSTYVHSSKDPLVVRWEKILTEDEMDYIEGIAKTSDAWTRSSVLRNGASITTKSRTSKTMNVDMNDPVIRCIRRKLCSVAHKSESSVEGFQLTEYLEGEEYKFHNDFFDDVVVADKGKQYQRVSTIFIYLTDVPEGCGGGTIFRDAVDKDGKPLKCIPKRGDGIMWKNLTERGEKKTRVMHSGEMVTCPGVRKLGMNVWFHFEKDDDYIHTYSTDNKIRMYVTSLWILLMLIMVVMGFLILL